MSLDKSLHYIYRVGSDNQYRLQWTGSVWRYDFVAGAVPFDEQTYPTEQELVEGLALHGLTLDKFSVDTAQHGAAYSDAVKQRASQLAEMGIDPCPKHGMTAKNPDGTCEACANTDYPDDFKGQEG
jgi:hypothetical protein